MSGLRGKVCVSCGRLSADYIEFKCPGCLKETIVRDHGCREKHTKYICPNCHTEGP
jgi:predicted RNA-binding Zn-ribbon protein involved in translation (DUF1610 family)